MGITNIDYTTRPIVLGKYYPITNDEAVTLAKRGQDKDLIDFVSDGPYAFLQPIMI